MTVVLARGDLVLVPFPFTDLSGKSRMSPSFNSTSSTFLMPGSASMSGIWLSPTMTNTFGLDWNSLKKASNRC